MHKLLNIVGIIGGGLLIAAIYGGLYADKDSYPREIDNFMTGLWATFTGMGAWPPGNYVGPFILGALFIGIIMWLESSGRRQRAKDATASERADLLP